MSKPQWVVTEKDAKLWGKAVGLSINEELLKLKASTKGYVVGKKGSSISFS